MNVLLVAGIIVMAVWYERRRANLRRGRAGRPVRR